MEYIEKQAVPPAAWETWFTKTTGGRSYDYKADYDILRNLKAARQHLLDEQHHLCAYCQRRISIDNSSIEHVIPKELNKALSTAYSNLVVVCLTQEKDSEGRLHCDKEKGNKIILPLIFLSNSTVTNSQNNRYFEAHADGSICAKPTLPDVEKKQIDSFIYILNLNHYVLKKNRTKDFLDSLIVTSRILHDNVQRRRYWKKQYERIAPQKNHPHRQFLLIYINQQLGL